MTKTKFILCKMKVLERTEDNVMKVITSEYVRPEMSDYEKVVAAHAWIIRNVNYPNSYFFHIANISELYILS